jgi:hypothetical protein
MIFQTYPTRSGFIYLGLTTMAGALAVFLITRLPQQSSLPQVFTLLVGILLVLGIMGIALYWAIVAFRLHYDLNRNGLAIQWGLVQQRIPFENIERVIPVKNLPALPAFKGINFNLGGIRFGWGELAEYGRLRFHSTANLAESLLVVTPHYTYVISPLQSDQFIHAWQTRQTLGPTQKWIPGVRRSWPFNYPLLADPFFWGFLGLSALACFALFGYLSLTFPQLPRSLPIHFNAFGLADRIADKSALFNLPIVGALTLALNTVLGSLIYRWEKVAAYLLWGSALTFQLCLWLAILTLTP